MGLIFARASLFPIHPAVTRSWYSIRKDRQSNRREFTAASPNVYRRLMRRMIRQPDHVSLDHARLHHRDVRSISQKLAAGNRIERSARGAALVFRTSWGANPSARHGGWLSIRNSRTSYSAPSCFQHAPGAFRVSHPNWCGWWDSNPQGYAV